MDNHRIENKFCNCLGSDNVKQQEPMSRHTTFRIGGPADFYLCPHSTKEVQEIVEICKEEKLPYFVLGNGSNLLVSDRGYRGVVIQLWKNFSDITVKDCCIQAKAGALLSKVAAEALEAGLTGMEFASGIPGTIGGAAFMNAGAYGGEMKDIIKSVKVLDTQGEARVLPKEELKMGYRTQYCKGKRLYCAFCGTGTYQGKSGRNPQYHGRFKGAQNLQTASGNAKRRKYLQKTGGIFCGKTDYGQWA